ncbi:MAG TPA: hypothetical protein VKO84_09235 [Gaiellaceae bacterium]|nr:hypothetical protein [Gaiellaceae bacterium]
MVVGLDEGEHLLGEIGLAGEDAALEQPGPTVRPKKQGCALGGNDGDDMPAL